MVLLNKQEIKQKIERLSIEILEHHYEEVHLVLIGINERGKIVAERIAKALEKYAKQPIQIDIETISLHVAAPTEHPILFHGDLQKLKHKIVILVDDVANSGRTLYYALKPLLEIAPKKVEIAVMIDRRHKKFPIRPNYVGMSLATTIENHIEMSFEETSEQAILI